MSAVEELLSKLLHPARLLLVKSDKSQVDLLRQQVQKNYDCEVDWASSAEEAGRYLSQDKYDLLLLEASSQHLPSTVLIQQAKQLNVPTVIVSDLPCNQAMRHGVFCELIGQLKSSDIDDLFDLFKIHVRSHENTRYFESRNLVFRTSMV